MKRITSVVIGYGEGISQDEIDLGIFSPKISGANESGCTETGFGEG